MSTEPSPSPDTEPIWFAGFDWGSEKHRVSLFARDGTLIGRRDVDHSARAYAELGDWLLRTTQAQPAAIAVLMPVGKSTSVTSKSGRETPEGSAPLMGSQPPTPQGQALAAGRLPFV